MKAPDFTLPDQNENLHSLSDYTGKWLVLYFYPKDDTPGCTAEACNFRDGRDVLTGLGITVVGVNKNSVDSHRAFAEKYNLGFTLLSDPDHTTIEAYGAWGLLGTKRNTVLINPKGELVKTYEGVDPSTHINDIVKDFRALQTAS